VENHFGQNWQRFTERQGEMTEKLYLYDVVDATPRFVVRGRMVCRLTSGEAVFAIDGDARTMTPIGADKPRVQDPRRLGRRRHVFPEDW
jgi:hypothetical protein